MKGFFGHNINQNTFSFGYESNHKFEDDFIFFESEDITLGVDGVVLNRTQLVESKKDWGDFFIHPQNSLENQLLKLKGAFHGFIYKKGEDELILFNDTTANKNFSFYVNGNDLAFYPDDYTLIKALKKFDIQSVIQKKAMYSFLAYGYLHSEMGWVQHAQRLAPGTILKFKNGKIFKKPYHIYASEPKNHSSKNHILNELEDLFRNAVQLQYQKDSECKYLHFNTLSGGLDSRATVLMAYELGFTNQTAFTCSQSGYADETIAREIANAYHFKHYFHPLDSFEHLFQIDDMNAKIGSTAVYSGPAHVIYGIEQFWENRFGIIHSGHVGDGVMGSFLSSKKIERPNPNFRRASHNLLPKIPEFDNELIHKYHCEEDYKLHEIGFNHAASGVWGLEHLSYNISPFIDKDVLTFLLSLPYELKFNRKIYIEWMLKFHPEWTNFKLESIHSKPNALWKLRHQKTLTRLRFGLQKVLSKDFHSKFKMAPEQYWYQNSHELQSYYLNEFHKAKQKLAIFDIPFADNMANYFESKQYINRAKVLHMASIINLIYPDE